jgi:hypothetical protein
VIEESVTAVHRSGAGCHGFLDHAHGREGCGRLRRIMTVGLVIIGWRVGTA